MHIASNCIAHTSPAQPAPIDATPTDATPHSQQFCGFKKGKIIFAYEQEWGHSRIADHIEPTVQSFIKRYIERGTHENEDDQSKFWRIGKYNPRIN